MIFGIVITIDSNQELNSRIYNYINSLQHISFNSKGWIAENSACLYFSKRKKMSQSLQQHLKSKPFNKQSIEKILGKPQFYKEKKRWSYYAGFNMIDCESFDVLFNEQGIVINSKVVDH